jgi:hypothetical protein
MTKVFGMFLLMVGVSGLGLAISNPVPEIDPGSAGSALALLSGAVLIFRSHRKKQS